MTEEEKNKLSNEVEHDGKVLTGALATIGATGLGTGKYVEKKFPVLLKHPSKAAAIKRAKGVGKASLIASAITGAGTAGFHAYRHHKDKKKVEKEG